MWNVRIPFVLVILLAASMAPFALSEPELGDYVEVENSAGRALVDFTIVDVDVGNASKPAETWGQPDGTTAGYLIRNTMYEVRITFKNAGTGLSSVEALGTLEIVHPIGYIIDSWSFNLSLAGNQESVQIVEWTPTASHSIAADNGTLHGGMIFRGTIDGGVLDTNDANDVYEEQIPVAIWHDRMEGTSLSYYTPQWVPVAYTDRNPRTLYGGGTDWQTDNSSASAGDRHWRVSNPGNDYASNIDDMLRWGWFVPTDGNCDDPGHGLGWGAFDQDIQAYYGVPFCLIEINDYDHLSVQWATDAWGSMGAGDEMALEALRGFSSIQQLNLTTAGVSGAQDDWTQVIWNMTDVHNDNSYRLSYTKIADASLASEGMHIDDFVLLAVERVNQYTVSLDCNDPLPNAYVVIPADSNPPSLYCELTNNGYREKQITVSTEVSNQTWMNNFPLRIDSDNMLDHDNFVTLNPVPGGATSAFWVNLTIPEGANIETLNWTVRFLDAPTGDEKAGLLLPVSVSSSYSVRISESAPAYPALTLTPGEVGEVMMKVKNTGNQFADWNLGAYFDSSLWGASNLAWYEDWDEDGNKTMITSLSLSKGEERPITARFTTPSQALPGLVEISLVASGVPPANAQSVKRIYIDVPAIQNVTVTPAEDSMTAHANGLTRTMAVTLTNHGNSPERFDLTLNADWHIGAMMNTAESEEIDPFGGETTVMVILEMPTGLLPSFYPITITARSQSDSSLFGTGQFTLEVPTTYMVEVEDKDMSDQTFRGGDEPNTLNFQIFNHGNGIDAFNIDLTMDVGVIATISNGVSDGRTAFIEPGTSTNVTLSYAFDDGTQGSRTLSLMATSVESEALGTPVTASGNAVFQVGSIGWIRLEAGEEIHITESGTHQMTITVHNQHPTDEQQVRLSVQLDDAVYYLTRVDVATADKVFILDPDAIRVINIEVRVTETNLANLDADTMSFNVTLTAEADDDVAQITMGYEVDRYVESGSSDSAGDSGFALQNIVIWVISVIAILTLGVVLVKVLMSTEHEDEISMLSGYESSLALPEAPTVPDAPTLPSADATANSMYGGTQDLFEQPVMATPPPPTETPEPEATPDVASGGPLVPESGLPEGWTMEQWAHYGEEYLRRQNEG